MHLYYSELEDKNNGYAVYYLGGDFKQQVKVTHAVTEKDVFVAAVPNDLVYIGEGRFGWSHRMNTLRKTK